MTAHLGCRVSALLDGQLPPAETERAWAHVHECHACRDLVEREGWVKTRLAGLSQGLSTSAAPDRLKGALAGLTPGPGAGFFALGPPPEPARHRTGRVVGLAALGGGAVGAAVVGVLALGAAPADTPSITRTPVPRTVSTTTAPARPGPTVASTSAPVGVRTRH